MLQVICGTTQCLCVSFEASAIAAVVSARTSDAPANATDVPAIVLNVSAFVVNALADHAFVSAIVSAFPAMANVRFALSAKFHACTLSHLSAWFVLNTAVLSRTVSRSPAPAPHSHGRTG